MARRVLLDVDPGHDDAIALLLALGHDALDVRAITTVAGNQTLSKVTENAGQILTVADRTDVRLAAGMAEPMVRSGASIGVPEVHGETGLDGPSLPASKVDPIEDHAIDTITKIARQTEDLTLVPTGPLSNIGMALRQHPDLVDDIEEIVLMGGAEGPGNYTPSAEYNVLLDPEAADIVFQSQVDVTMIGLDVTRSATASPPDIDRIRALDTAVARTVADWLTYFQQYHESQFDRDGVPIHDALAVAYVIEQSLIETTHCRVDVETRSELATGRTVVDTHGATDRPANVRVARKVQRDQFIDLLVETLEGY